jgi:hypothetical protein
MRAMSQQLPSSQPAAAAVSLLLLLRLKRVGTTCRRPKKVIEKARVENYTEPFPASTF